MIFFLLIACTVADSSNKLKEISTIEKVPFNNVLIDDEFWLPKLKVYKNNTIPHGWKYMEPILNEAKGIVGQEIDQSMGDQRWYEANLYKHLEAVFYSLHQFPDQKEAKKVEYVIDLLKQAQKDNGYLYLFGQNRALPEWANVINQDESLAAGHLYEAAITHHILSGNNSFLTIAMKSAQHAYNHFVKNSVEKGFPGHAAMEGGLIDLYRGVGNKDYLALSKEFIERRGHSLNGINCVNGENLIKLDPRFYPCEYFQDHAPFNLQTKLKGHAVRGVNFLTGIVDVAIETGDSEFVQAGLRLWKNLIERNMYITGSAGPLQRMESFGMDYELPNSGVNESCTAVSIANLASKMLLLENNSEYSDILEKVLYNAVLHGISLEGNSFYYSNPLEGNKKRGNPWSCCPPNIYRTLLGVGKYIYTQSSDDIYTHLYVGSETEIQFKDKSVQLIQKTGYPLNGKVEFLINSERTDKFGISFRIPDWCNEYSVKINDELLDKSDLISGYLKITKVWGTADKVELDFKMPIVLMESHPNLKNNFGKVAIQRGPIVYAFEGEDDEMENAYISEDFDFKIKHVPGVLNGALLISGESAENKVLEFVPYYALSNRGKLNTKVWLKAKGKGKTISSEVLYGQYNIVN
ncbi:glycoside hydrolase family 127 protein [Membranihabitans marinus]